MHLLHVDSSILGEASISRELSAALVTHQHARHPGIEVTYRDLAAQPVPHLSGAYMAALTGATANPSDEIAVDLALGNKVLEEFLTADIVVIGAPMYNFTISSQLKAWIDRLAVPGKAFRYTAEGPQGLLGGKKIIVASSRGGFYGDGTPLAVIDHQEKYLSAVFGFCGITDVTYIRAEGVAISPENREKAIQDAMEQIAVAA